MGDNEEEGTERRNYSPVQPHWFYTKLVEKKVVWLPFSLIDSINLEDSHQAHTQDVADEICDDDDEAGSSNVIVPTDGGRYDVDVGERRRVPIYWRETHVDQQVDEVRRCTWFYKVDAETRFEPYSEEVAAKLEEEYKIGFTSGVWQRRLEFPGGENIVIHNSNVIVHFKISNNTLPDDFEWTSIHPEGSLKPHVVKRGVEEFDNIVDGEPNHIQHLILVVHGIGDICDLKFRNLIECVDDMRSISLTLMKEHFNTAMTQRGIGRVEFLPVQWHSALHGDATGVDKRLKAITLPSVGKLREYMNSTLVDILFYTSPKYCETISNTVGEELNRVYQLFIQRNPNFTGKVSVAGHSLGSLILFDLLAHQHPTTPISTPSTTLHSTSPVSTLYHLPENDGDNVSSHKFMLGLAGTGQPHVNYPQLEFIPTSFFALGSPIGVFTTVRGIETLGEDFSLPTCHSFLNIFHPYDPVAYRIEPLIKPGYSGDPVLIPHHKGRKRLHLEIREGFQKVSFDLKQKFYDSMQNLWSTLSSGVRYPGRSRAGTGSSVGSCSGGGVEGEVEEMEQVEQGEVAEEAMGSLNGGERVDHVLQEKPIESFNDYLFALATHVCYWESEDTLLLILSQVYKHYDVRPDITCSAQTSQPEVIAAHSQASLAAAAANTFNSDDDDDEGCHNQIKS